jgi:hypothetical protein
MNVPLFDEHNRNTFLMVGPHNCACIRTDGRFRLTLRGFAVRAWFLLVAGERTIKE